MEEIFKTVSSMYNAFGKKKKEKLKSSSVLNIISPRFEYFSTEVV